MSSSNGTDRSKRWKARLYWLILLFILLLPFLICEFIYYRKFQREFGSRGYTKELLAMGRVQDSPYSVYEQIPNTISLKADFRQNNQGFRDEDDTGPKKKGAYRIFILGGSGALGQGAMQEFIQISGQQEYPSEHTIAARLEAKLQEAYPGREIEVINAAVSGYKVNHEYGLYMSKLRHLDPDMIILLDGYNDLFFPIDPNFYVCDLDREAWKENLYKKDPAHRYGMWLMARSYALFYLGKHIFTDKFEYNEEIYKQWLNTPLDLDTTAWRAYFNTNKRELVSAMDDVFDRYEIFRRTCDVDSVRVLHCPQPLLPAKPHKTDVERALYAYLLSQLDEDGRVRYHTLFPYFLARYDKWASEQGLDYVNLQNEIDRTDRDVFVDYCHMSFNGNDLVAEAIKRKLLEMHAIDGRNTSISDTTLVQPVSKEL